MARKDPCRHSYDQSCALYRYFESGGRDPREVGEYWHRAFCCVARQLGFDRPARKVLWEHLARGNWNHPIDGKEATMTSEDWLEALCSDVLHCSDRWSLDRLTRCHWKYRQYVRAVSGEGRW